MELELKGPLLDALLDCVEGVCVVEETGKRIVYANRCLTERWGPAVGEPCYRVLMGRDTPCPFCPTLQAGEWAYPWDWFDPKARQWVKIKSQLAAADGVLYRVCNFNAVGDMMDLSREAVTELGALNRAIQQYDMAKSELEYESTHDRMTRLYNRNQYIRDISGGERLSSAGVIFFDLNNLKQINDHYRHAAGDMLLLRLAAALGPADGQGSRAYRIGGDEFVVLYKNGTSQDLDDCLAEILAALDRRNEGETLKCSVAVGKTWSDDVSDLEKLVSIADKRMYEDKERHRRERKD